MLAISPLISAYGPFEPRAVTEVTRRTPRSIRAYPAKPSRFALIVSAFLFDRARPRAATEQASAAATRASGKCRVSVPAAVFDCHEYEPGAHAARGATCLDCHQPAQNQHGHEHHGFVIVAKLTAGNRRARRESFYQEILRSRHAAA